MRYPIDCISDFIFYETDIKKADIILVPGSDESQLAKEAAQLYGEGYSNKILISGGLNENIKDFGSEAEYLANICKNLGVEERDIILEPEAQNTFQNANFSYNTLKSQGIRIDSAIIVCKGYHSRRAFLTYKTVFPKNIEIFVNTLKEERMLNKYNWHTTSQGVNIVMEEVRKIGSYFVSEIELLKRLHS